MSDSHSGKVTVDSLTNHEMCKCPWLMAIMFLAGEKCTCDCYIVGRSVEWVRHPYFNRWNLIDYPFAFIQQLTMCSPIQVTTWLASQLNYDLLSLKHLGCICMYHLILCLCRCAHRSWSDLEARKGTVDMGCQSGQDRDSSGWSDLKGRKGTVQAASSTYTCMVILLESLPLQVLHPSLLWLLPKQQQCVS